MKLFSRFVLCLLCLALCLPASAEMDGVFEINGDVLTVRAPEGAQTEVLPVTAVFEMEQVSLTLEENGTRVSCWRVPETEREEPQLAAAAVQAGEEGWLLLFGSEVGGGLVCLGISRMRGDVFVDCSEGYEYSGGRTLMVRLPGSEYTGYEWTFIPDNSGACDLADQMEIDMTPAGGEEGVITATATGFFFVPVPGTPAREGRVRFERTGAPEGAAPAGPVTVRFTLDASGEFADLFVETE